MMLRAWILLILCVPMSACVYSGGARNQVDLEEAARLNTQLGLDYLKQGNTEVALGKFNKSLEQDDSRADTFMGLGLTYARFGEPGRAKEYFEQALRRGGREPQVLNSYGSFLCEQGEVERAQTLFARALAVPRYPTPEQSYAASAACHERAGDLDAAEAAYRRALEHNPRMASALLRLADISQTRSDFLRSRAFIQRFESLYDDSAESLLLGLRAEYALGNDAGAQNYGRRLQKLAPQVADQINLRTGRAR